MKLAALRQAPGRRPSARTNGPHQRKTPSAPRRASPIRKKLPPPLPLTKIGAALGRNFEFVRVHDAFGAGARHHPVLQRSTKLSTSAAVVANEATRRTRTRSGSSFT